MTKDVLVSISGLHMDMDAQIPGPDEDDVIEVVTPATYYYRNGKHYIIYDEIVEGVSDTIKNKIKISGTDFTPSTKVENFCRGFCIYPENLSL